MAFSFQPKLASLDGLVLYLDAANTKSYPGSGTTWRDLTAIGSICTLTNGPAFNSENGGSIVFDGTNDFVNIGHKAEHIPSTTLTLGVVFKLTATQSIETTPMIKEIWVSPTSNAGYLIRVTASGSVYTLIWNNGGYSASSAPNTINTGSIYHVMGTFNGNTISTYVNGVLVASSSYVGTIRATGASLQIPQNYDGLRLTGNIYSAQIYNRTLSATEVLQNYNALKGRFGLT